MNPLTLQQSAVDGLIDSKTLSSLLGVPTSTIRSWRHRGNSNFPRPVGELDGKVWRVEDLVRWLEDGGLTTTSEDLTAKRARGAFYTPENASQFMADWVLRESPSRVLEPSFGGGAFISATNSAAKRQNIEISWVAHELNPAEADKLVALGLLKSSELRLGDYLADSRYEPVDAVIANPPFVRLRNLNSTERQAGMEVCKRILGKDISADASSWVPFLLKMAAQLSPDGCMAVVLPLDFTYVRYALPVWKWLGENFGRLKVVRTHDRIFGDLNQDVLLLFASKKGKSTDEVLYETYTSSSKMFEGLTGEIEPLPIAEICSGKRVFQYAHLPAALRESLDTRFDGFLRPASDVASFRIGYVAGDKDFFHPTKEFQQSYRLQQKNLRGSITNARKLKGAGLYTSKASRDKFTSLWLPDPNDLNKGEQEYVRFGESNNVHKGYKCRQRKDWFVVPGVRVPDAVLTVFSQVPQLLVNDAEFVASNSQLCIYLNEGMTPEEFAVAWYNPLTLLSLNLEVHSLGGGVLVMVPNEGSRVLIPRKVQVTQKKLQDIEACLLDGDVIGAYMVGADGLKKILSAEKLEQIMTSVENLRFWREK